MSHELLFIIAGVVSMLQETIAYQDKELRMASPLSKILAKAIVLATNIGTLELLRWLGGMVGG